MTFEQMCDIEPALRQLAEDVMATPARRYADDVDTWERCDFRQRMEKLVGWYAAQESIRENGHYDLAYRTLREITPPGYEEQFLTEGQPGDGTFLRRSVVLPSKRGAA